MTGDEVERGPLMTPADIQAALDEVFDQAIVFHSFTDYMRDYEVITYSVADPTTGIKPAFDRYLFTNCVSATTTTTLDAEGWSRSLDDHLTTREAMNDAQDGYVWGVRWQCNYPGAEAVEESEAASEWTRQLGIRFVSTVWSANGHRIELLHSGLTVSRIDAGYAPFIATHD